MEKKIEEEKNFNKDLYKLYNMVIKIDSMDQLTKEGWQIIRKEAKKINDKNVKGKQVSIISVLGNKNTGKSFILHLLTGKKIPNGYTVTTEGLSLIIPDDEDNKDENCILIDTAGTESPLLIENTDPETLSIDLKDKMAKDRQITDYFLQKFILEKSDIFICVVDNLTLTDQKFLNRIIKNYTNKNIFIIHNLKTFIEKDQVESYIKETLQESLTFHLQKDEYFDLDSTEKLEENSIYFKQKLKENNRTIIHLIIANEDSPAGKYYNKSTINYLNKQLSQIKEKKPFDIIKNLKEFLISFSGEIFNKKIEESSLKEENDCIKIVNNEDLDLKDCLIDELGNKIIRETKYKPKYRYGYFTDSSTEEKKFFLEIELFGIWEFTRKIEIKDDFFIITIKGEKVKKITGNEYEFQNYIPSNDFELEIKVDNCKGIVEDEPKTEEENGLYILIFPLRKRKIEEDVISSESEEDDDV